MPKYEVVSPDGKKFDVNAPEGASEQDAIKYVQNNFYGAKQQPSAPVKLGKEAFSDTLRETLQNADWGTRNIAGAGTAISDVWQGMKQFAGKGDADAIAANKIIQQEAPIGSIAGSAAMTALPFGLAGNSLKAAGAIGAGYGALQPVEGDQGMANVLQGKAINTALGGVTAAGGQALANKAGQFVTKKAAEMAANKARNAPIDATIREALAAGYVLPPAQINPTFANRQLESLGGKIATQQMASARNQEVTDQLARKAAGLLPDEPITPDTLKAARNVIKKPYEDIAALGLQPKLNALDAARAEANAAWREYSRQGTRSALNDFKVFSATAKQTERDIEKALFKANKPDLMKQFRDARVALAKNHDVESALIEGGGTVDARAIGRMFQRGDKMTGELATIGKFANNFRKDVQPGASMGTPDSHNLKSMLSLAAGGGGAAAFGPLGIAAGALPLVAGPAARAVMFSKPMQQGLLRDYALPASARLAKGVASGGLLNYTPAASTVLGLEALDQ